MKSGPKILRKSALAMAFAVIATSAVHADERKAISTDPVSLTNENGDEPEILSARLLDATCRLLTTAEPNVPNQSLRSEALDLSACPWPETLIRSWLRPASGERPKDSLHSAVVALQSRIDTGGRNKLARKTVSEIIGILDQAPITRNTIEMRYLASLISKEINGVGEVRACDLALEKTFLRELVPILTTGMKILEPQAG